MCLREMLAIDYFTQAASETLLDDVTAAKNGL